MALVTGATSGIGEAIARTLCQCQAKMALVGRRKEALARLSLEMKNSSPDIQIYSADLADSYAIESLGQQVQKDFGGVDILVHAAGIYSQARLEASTSAEFDRQFQINLLAPHSLTRLFSQSLKERKGQVVFINSSVARRATAERSQYTATKSGLKAMADSFREEFNPDGVRVLSVFAGRTATPMQEAIFRQEGRPYTPERLLQPSDVADVVELFAPFPHRRSHGNRHPPHDEGMRFLTTHLEGAIIVEPEAIEDSRGFFARTFCAGEFAGQGMASSFVQCSVSLNRKKGTVRGLHFQRPPASEAKLVRVTAGALLDVIVDLRPDSPTYLKHIGVELSAQNHRALYVPKMFAHGFQTLEDDTEVFYQISEFYSPDASTGMRYNDPKLKIQWPLPVTTLSDKDANWPLL